MKKLYLISALAIIMSGSAAFSQPAAAPAPKIVIVNTSAFFDEKFGITKIVAAGKQVNDGVAGDRNNLMGLVNRAKSVEKELEVLQENARKNIPVDQKTVEAKAAELDRLQREGKFREDDFNALIKKRQSEIVGPQYAAVLQALEGYIKSKGYAMVFDVSKDQGGMLIYAVDQYDITKDFITFYNTRPAGTAAATPPK